MIINYTTSVHTLAGWRGVTIRAEAERISAGMARVIRVLAIDGEMPQRTMSRTGARRQEYHGIGIADREVGARKRLSACTIISFEIGDRVEGGTGEDHDTGRIERIEGDTAFVAWDSGVKTPADLSSLTKC